MAELFLREPTSLTRRAAVGKPHLAFAPGMPSTPHSGTQTAGADHIRPRSTPKVTETFNVRNANDYPLQHELKVKYLRRLDAHAEIADAWHWVVLATEIAKERRTAQSFPSSRTVGFVASIIAKAKRVEHETASAEAAEVVKDGVLSLLSTIARAHGDLGITQFTITEEDSLKDAIAKAILFRIPVAAKWHSHFLESIYEDLREAARGSSIGTKYWKLKEVVDGELVLQIDPSELSRIKFSPGREQRRSIVTKPTI